MAEPDSAPQVIDGHPEHEPDVDADGQLTGVCICGRKLISERGVMRLYCKKSRPPRRSIKSLQVYCWHCHAPDTYKDRDIEKVSGLPIGARHRLSDQDIAFDTDHLAYHRACGTHVHAHVGGWNREVRSTCQGCGATLEKRQVRWCARRLGHWTSVCSVAWSTPGELWRTLADRQHGICGICLLKMESYRNIEVDHVIPRAADGPRTLENLRAAHLRCNKAKSDYSLMHARARMGMTPDVIEERLEGLPEDVAVLLRAAELQGDMTVPARRLASPARAVPEGQVPLEGLVW